VLQAAWARDSCPGLAAAQARSAYKGLDYATAMRATEEVEQCEDGSPAELADALRWRGLALAAQNDNAGAIKAFALLSLIAPDYVVDPFLSPKVHELFRAGRAEARQRPTVFARVVAPQRRDGELYARVERYGAPAVGTFTFPVGGTKVNVPAHCDDAICEARVPRGASGEFAFRAEPANAGTDLMAIPAVLTASIEADPPPLRAGAPLPAPDIDRAPAPSEAIVQTTPSPSTIRSKAWIPAAAGVAVAGVGLALVVNGNNIANQIANPQSSLAQSIASGQSSLGGAINSARTSQDLGAAGLVIGIAGVAAGAGMYLFGGSPDSPEIAVGVAPGAAGIAARCRF
jgi:hypothetical protein